MAGRLEAIHGVVTGAVLGAPYVAVHVTPAAGRRVLAALAAVALFGVAARALWRARAHARRGRWRVITGDEVDRFIAECRTEHELSREAAREEAEVSS